MRYSQYEEDDIIQAHFGGFVGRFLDLGAADGLCNSNTRALVERGWSGVCVEPNPYLFNELFKRYRQNECIGLVHAAISGDGRVLKFHHADQLSTACEEITRLENMSQYFRGSYFIPSLSPDTLASLVGNTFHFVSIDCEAMDSEIAAAAGALFEYSKLVCYEHSLPGLGTTEGYTLKMAKIMASHGFTRQVGRTKGNILIAR